MLQLRSHFIKFYLKGKKKNASRPEHVALTKPMYSVMEFSVFLFIILSHIFKIYSYTNNFLDLPYTYRQRTDG